MIQKILNKEEVWYSSNLNEENLKKKIEDLFEQNTLRIAGKLTSENEFAAYDKWVVIGWDIPNLKRRSAYLKGEIVKGEKGTLIKLKVKPNSILPIFAVLFTLVGLILTLKAILNTENDKFFFFGLIFILLGVIYYPMSTVLRNRLRNKIVKSLSLNKV